MIGMSPLEKFPQTAESVDDSFLFQNENILSDFNYIDAEEINNRYPACEPEVQMDEIVKKYRRYQQTYGYGCNL